MAIIESSVTFYSSGASWLFARYGYFFTTRTVTTCLRLSLLRKTRLVSIIHVHLLAFWLPKQIKPLTLNIGEEVAELYIFHKYWRRFYVGPLLWVGLWGFLWSKIWRRYLHYDFWVTFTRTLYCYTSISWYMSGKRPNVLIWHTCNVYVMGMTRQDVFS